MVIPPRSRDGLIIRLRGLGARAIFNLRAPFRNRRSGDLLLKLFVYPDNITPSYVSFEMLSTDDMALEGWVYQKIDEVIHKIGNSAFLVKPVRADEIADLFNEQGSIGVFRALVRHLKLTHLDIELTESSDICLPGSCQRFATATDRTSIAYNYMITINERFLDNPFSIAAIIAHELCHVVNYERIDDMPKSFGHRLKSDKESLEEERTVDLLVFMFKIGEFQLRVARDKRLTFGYFNQPVFERIYAIVSRKLNEQ